ncbi:MAG: transposase [Gammaproteobacteria bacterium]
MSQVAVLLSYVNLKVAQGFWSWIDGALFLPQVWFGDNHEKLRQRLGVPQAGGFKTKVELAWELIERALAADLPFDRVGFDCLYGRSGELRAKVRQAGKLYMAEVPADTQVCLDRPVLGVPPRQSKRGRPPSAIQVLSGDAVRVDSLREKLPWHEVQVRATDRGEVVRPVCRLPGVDGAGRRGRGGLAGDASGSERQALLRPMQRLSRDFVRATGLVEVPTLLHRAFQPGRQIGVGVGRAASSKVPCLGAPFGVDGAGLLVRSADQVRVGTGLSA